MRQWLRKLEAMATATAFAQAGEWQMARSILNESEKRATDREVSRVRPPRTRVREQSHRG